MYCDLTRIKAEMTKRYLSKLRKTISRHVLVVIVLVFCFQSMSFAEVTQADIDKLGQQTITLKDGKSMTLKELTNLTESEKIQIVNGLNRVDKIKYKEFELHSSNQRNAEMDKYIVANNQRIAEMDKQLEASQAEGKALDKQLVEKYTLYIGNAEKLGKCSKKVFNYIMTNEASPEALKQRTRALLADKNMKWED